MNSIAHPEEASSFPHYAAALEPLREKELLEGYCQSVGGKAFVHVPVGASLRGYPHYIGAVRRTLSSPNRAVAEVQLFQLEHAQTFARWVNHAGIELIEAAQKLDYNVVGRLLTGAVLLASEYQPLHVGMVVVCEKADALFERFCHQQGIQVWKPEANRTLRANQWKEAELHEQGHL